MRRRVAVALAVVALTLHVRPSPAAPPAAPPVLPPSTFQSVRQEVLIPMDDGVRLAATVVRPSVDGKTPVPGPVPVVLSMTPYGRNGLCGCPDPNMFATRGIAAAVVDVRGTGGSEGDLTGNYFSPREARDGYLLVEHFGTQPWSSGRVGMAGGSYVGITQYLTAEQRPPHLAAIVPQVALGDLYRDGFTHGGIVNLSFDLQYIAVQGAPGALGPNADPALLDETIGAKLGQSPPGMIAFDYLARPDDDPFYVDRSPIYRAGDIEVPVLVLGSWRDGLQRGQTEMYRALARRPGVETRLVMDPCTHKGCGPPLAPLTDAPGRYNVSALIFEFLAQHLTDAEAPDRPPVEVYVQARNEWASAPMWPPPGTRMERLALGPDGTLGADVAGPATAQYVSNPAAGLSMTFNRFGTVAATPYVPTDQRLEEPHGLTFRTEPFDRATPLIGPLALHLVAASSATDTDWYVKLADVAPDGSEAIITEGALRASHRAVDPAKSEPGRPYHTHVDPQPIEPGRFYDYDIEIWPTAYELAAGHRLQVRVTSSDLPTHFAGTFVFDRDHPEATRLEVFAPATNTVRLGESFLLVPTTAPAVLGASVARPAAPAAERATLPATGGGEAPLALVAALLVAAGLAGRVRRASVR